SAQDSGGFKRASNGCANRDNPPSGQLCLVDDFGIVGTQNSSFAVDVMLLDLIHPHRLKGIQADVKLAVRRFYAFVAQSQQQFRREMQSGGGRSRRAFLLAVDGLVAL